MKFLRDIFYILKLNIEFLFTLGWLLGLYFISIWLAIGTLSSYQFQQKVNSSDPSKNEKQKVIAGRYSVQSVISYIEERYSKGKINEFLKENEEILKNYNSYTTKGKFPVWNNQSGLKEEEYYNNQKSIEKTSYVKIQIGKLLNGVNGLKSKLTVLNEDISPALKKYDEMEANPNFPNKETELKEILDKIVSTGLINDKIFEEALNEKTIINDINLKNSLSYLIQRKEIQLGMFSDYNDLVVPHKKNEVFTNTFAIEDQKMESFVAEFKSLKDYKFDIFATMPVNLLTLILTLSMGAFGSVIFMTRELFTRSSKRSFLWFLFRPFLGMVTAIALFVFIKSGQNLITDSSFGEGVEAVNPFFLSFVGIVAGLLSEQALERIQVSGKKILKIQESNDMKWAFQLKKEMEFQGKTSDELCRYTEEKAELVKEWMEEKTPVTPENQRIIAVWLKKEQRELFTDLPPAS